ncbi:MAG: HAD family hydrolase [Promethearchaeati archaeon SRVP18_Atabeyarchaeia-1]
MSGKGIKVVFFDAMGTVISLRAWVTAMINEFTLFSKKFNVAFEDVSGAWDVDWRNVNREIRGEKTRPFQTVRELFHEAFVRIGSRIGLQLSEKDITGSVDRVYNYVNKHAETYRDVPETLEVLRKQGYRIGIISDADAEDLTVQLNSAGILDYFDLLTTSSEVKSYKPDARIFEVALAKADCKSGQACHVGDTPEFDILGANRVGLHSILITHGKAKVDVKSFKPTRVIKEVGEVVSVLHDLSI